MDPFRIKKAYSISTLRDYMGRVIVVSNRLPVTASLEQGEDGKQSWEFKMSSGGLVAGLEGVKKKLPFLWIGWTGSNLPEDQKKSFSEQLLEKNKCIPVFMDDKIADEFYNGFSNGVLWPLFHYLLQESFSCYDEKLWKSYVAANQQFADVVAQTWRQGDLIWVHDYHLMQLPQMLRQRIPKIRIGFFLHIPFPSSEIFQVLPVRKALLRGLLHCDMIGFHTYDYARHFLSACGKIMGLETSPAGVTFEGKFIPVLVNPVGIDVEKFTLELQTDPLNKILSEYQSNFNGKKVLLSVDRLDYIKGIPHRLKAFYLFLQQHPEWRGKVELIQVAVPSRTDVEQYKRLKAEVDTLVGHVNGEFGDLQYNPVHYLFKSIPFPELCALYRLSDAVLVTSIRDGMNLVAQEYIACQQNKHGILILSEFAGSASSLPGAILVNPWNTQNVADAIHESITMSEKEKKSRFETLYRYITVHNASRWGESFIKELDRIGRAADQMDKTPKATLENINLAYKRGHKRLLIFSSDGALISYAALPFLSTPSRRLTEVLTKLSKDPDNLVYVVSGRDRATLQQWFGNLPVGLVAEHGSFSTDNILEDPNWAPVDPHADLSWKTRIKPIFQHFTERTPGSFFEEKETSLTWHFRSAEREFGNFRAQELHALLDTATFPAQVLFGERSLEVRPYGCNYANVLKRIFAKHPDFDFALYIGEACNMDFASDSRVFSCSVGNKNLKYYLNNSEEVVQLLEQLTTENGSDPENLASEMKVRWSISTK